MKTQSLLSALASFLLALLLACGPDAAANLTPATIAAPAQPAVAAQSPEPQALAQDPVVPAAPPAWLPGTYARTARVDLDVVATGDAKTLKLAADGSYVFAQGTGAEETGKFDFDEAGLHFLSGALRGQSATLDDSCRILDGLGFQLWRDAEVEGCPTARRVSATECAWVGTHTRTAVTEGSTGIRYTLTTTIALARDGFYSYDSAKVEARCSGDVCQSATSRAATYVGHWSAAGGPNSIATLNGLGWDFVAATDGCGAP